MMVPILTLAAAAVALAMSVFNGYVFYNIYQNSKSQGAAMLACLAGLILITAAVSIIEIGQRFGMRPQMPRTTVDLARLCMTTIALAIATYQTYLLVWNPRWKARAKEKKA